MAKVSLASSGVFGEIAGLKEALREKIEDYLRQVFLVK
jgi:hypothetical protein